MFGRDHTDQRFAHYCRTGDPDALADVFDRTAGRLMRVALWLVGNRPDAEDLLQRTFLQAIEARASFELGRPVLPWLLGLLGNQARKLRSERQRATVVPAPADRVVDAVAEAAAKELEHAVGAVRDRLGAPYSEVLRLHLEEGLNGKEIAARLARPAGTVRTQLVRALEQLRRHLPDGFVAGLAALAVVDAAAVAAVRVGVLAAARAGAGPAAVGGLVVTTTTIGGLLMAKKLLLALPLVLLLGGAVWSLLRPSPSETSPPSGAVVVSAEVGNRAQELKQPPALVADATPERAPALPPATSGEPGFAALRVLVRRAQDKVPVAGTWVHAQADGSHLGYYEALTDDAGIARLDHLVPGSYFVATSLVAAYEQVSLTEGELRTLELVAKETSFVAGRVVDADGRPVAGARLWLSARSDWSLGGEVGRSAADGSFKVGLFAFHYLGAQADGHVPSLMQQFEAAQGRSFENVVLKLRGPAAGLQGLVVDSRGQPVPGATVLVGWPGGGVTTSGNQMFAEPNPERLSTGRDGRFVATMLPVGDVPLHVWAVGFGPHRQQRLPSAGRTESITVTLVDGAVVAGVVRDSAGKPVAKATVRFGDEFFSFPSCGTTTDEAGRFRLENLPAAPDSVSLVAFNASSSAAASLSLAAGATTAWNPVLGTGRTIRGIVLGPGEVHLPGAKVGVVHPSYQRVQRWFDTSADGSFELQQVGDKPCSVQVALGESVLREVRNVAPETANLRIQLDVLDLPTARLRGRIVDVDGKPLEGSVSLRRDRVLTSDSVQIDPGTGAFAFGPISAGRYRVSAYTKATGPLPLGAVELQPDEERVLADVVVQPGGEVELTVTDVDGELVDSRHVGLYTAAGDWIPGGVLESGKGKLAGLQPGRYLVEVSPARKNGSKNIAQVVRGSVEVQSGKTTPVTIRGRACVGVQITFRDLGPADPDRRVQVFCRNEQGQMDDVLETFRDGRTPMAGQGTFSPGRYLLECRVDDGRVVTAELVVPSLDQPVNVTIDLPAR